MNILNLTSKQLKQAAKIKDRIGSLENQLAKIFGGNGAGMPSPFVARKYRKRRMSAAGRLAISAAQKLRWSRVKRNVKPKGGKRKMSAAWRAKIAKAAKARWAKAKAAGKKSL
jgi:hypothetical protein